MEQYGVLGSLVRAEMESLRETSEIQMVWGFVSNLPSSGKNGKRKESCVCLVVCAPSRSNGLPEVSQSSSGWSTLVS